MNKKKALDLINRLIIGFEKLLDNGDNGEVNLTTLNQKVFTFLEKTFRDDATRKIEEFKKISYYSPIYTLGGDNRSIHKKFYISGIKTANKMLLAWKDEIETYWEDDMYYPDSKERNPVAFISYDYSVKSEVVDPLAEKLIKAGIAVWYDEYEIVIGDNIHDKIMDGLKQCKYCILIISKEYIENRKWAKREFENITALETQDGRNRILPVWHGVSKEEVMELEPRLGNIKGIRTDDFEYLYRELVRVLKS